MTTCWVGSPVKRREDPRLLTGRACFIDDLRLPRQAFGTVLRSPYARARIRRVDASRALAMPGVLAVLTAGDLGRANEPMPLLNDDPGFRHPRTHRALAHGEVRYVGEPVAFIVAEDRYLAEDAREAVEVDYQPEEPAVDLLAAMAEGAPLVHRDADSNIACVTRHRVGDVEAAFAAADRVVRAEFRPDRGQAQPLETRGVLAAWDDRAGTLHVWDSTQAPVSVRYYLAGKLDLPEACITVVTPDVGGGFGVKIMLLYAEEVLVPFAARALGRPVKWVEDRCEHFVGSNQERLMIHRMEAAVADDGRILGLRDHFVCDSGAYCPYGPINAICAQGVLPGPYKIPAIETEYTVVYTNTPIVSPYRGAGQPHGVFAMEMLINRIGQQLAIDKAEVRRRNLVRPEDCPWDAGVVFQNDAPLVHRDCDYPGQLETALQAIGYDDFRRTQAELRARGVHRGIGLGFYVEGTGIAPYEGVEVRVEPTGYVTVETGYPSQGQGHHTTLAQVVADELSVGLERILVTSGNTDRFSWGGGTFASRAAVLGGNSAHLAARRVREQALALAARELEVRPEDLDLAGGRVHVKGSPLRSVGLGDLANLANPINKLQPGQEPGLRATAYHAPGGGVFSSGVHAMIVEIDPDTAAARILRYVVVHDCGHMLNPMIVEGQIRGGVAQGVGGSYYERLVFNERGQLLTTTFMDYLLPTAMEVPQIEIRHRDVPSSLNPLGVKGLGEGGAIPGPACFADAVEDALAPFGALVQGVPLYPSAMLALVRRDR